MPATTRRRQLLRLAAGLLVPAGSPRTLQAQAAPFPARPLHLILPFAAGGVPDVAARLVGERLGPLLGQPVVIENRPGASGLLALQRLKQAPADGHSLLYADSSTWGTNPAVKLNPGYDPVLDLLPVSHAATMGFSLFVNAALPVRKLADLVALSKATPGGLSYASTGVGSIHHLAMERLRLATGARLVHVPFNGIAQAAVALAGGDVAAVVSTTLPMRAQLTAGRIRAIAVGSASHSRFEPGVPSLEEAGVRDLEIRVDQGFFVKAGTPAAVVQTLNGALRQALADAALERTLADVGVEVLSSSPQALGALVKADLQTYRAIVRQAQIERE